MPTSNRNICSKITQQVFQHPCELCLEPVDSTSFLCQACKHSLPFLENPCPVCSLPLQELVIKPSQASCGRCQKIPPSYDYSHCVFKYTSPIDAWIRALKDKRNIIWASLFAQYLKHHCKQVFAQSEHVCIIPSKPKKLFQRGFNPTQLLAEKLKSSCHGDVHYDFFTLHKAKEQRELSAKQRKANLKKSLHVKQKKHKISGHWLILEDVVTTGATIERAAYLLKKQGASKVGVCALARVMENRYPQRLVY